MKYKKWIISSGTLVCMGLTVYFSIKDTIRYTQNKEEKNFKNIFKNYWRTAAFGSLTFIGSVSGIILDFKKEAALLGAYKLIDQFAKKYERSDDFYKNWKYDGRIDEKMFFYDDLSGRTYETSPRIVIEAEHKLNDQYIQNGSVTLNDYYRFMQLDTIKNGDDLGWSVVASDAYYGYPWIEFVHEKVTLDDGMECCMISFPFLPTSDFK